MKILDKLEDKLVTKIWLSLDGKFPEDGERYWQRVDDTDILRVDGTQIEVFE